MTRVYAPELYQPRKRWPLPKHELHIRANSSVDPALLAIDLNITENYVRMVKRKLGLKASND